MSSLKLPDLLQPGLRLVVCGFAAGSRSAELGLYYAGHGNKFWKTLAQLGIAPLLRPEEFPSLGSYGIGLTDLAKSHAGSDRHIPTSALDKDGFLAKMKECRPKAIAFNGKAAAEFYFGAKVSYGRQTLTIAGATVYVLPSTSGAANGSWDFTFWEQMAEEISLDTCK